MKLHATVAFAAYVLALGASSPMASAQPSGGFRIVADTVTTGENRGVQGVPCVNQTIFFAGDVIVFRASIADGPTGTPLTQADITSRGIEAVVTTSEGRMIPLRFGLHPPPQVNVPKRAPYWSGTLAIPKSHPTGTLPWSLTVTDKSGQKTTFSPIGQDVGAAVLTIAAPKS